jgi:hypothetical protein
VLRDLRPLAFMPSCFQFVLSRTFLLTFTLSSPFHVWGQGLRTLTPNTGFIFLLLRSPILLALPLLLHPRRCSLSDTIIWVTLVAPDCLHFFIEVFYSLFQVKSL